MTGHSWSLTAQHCMKILAAFLFIFTAIMVYTNLDKFNHKEVLYYGLTPRDGIHIEICKWPRPTKLISWSGHDNEDKMVTGMRIAPWRQDIPSMKLFISGLTVNRSVELGEVSHREIGGVRSLVMNTNEYRIIWQNVKGTDDVNLARLFDPSGSSVIVDLRQRTGLPPEAFPGHQEHDPRHDAAWSPWLGHLGGMMFSEWTSVSISGSGIRRTLFSAKFENGWQDTLMVYDDNGMSDKRPLVWEPVQDIIPTDEDRLGYWLVTAQGSWFEEVMDAILSRHPTLAEISKRDKNFIHESLIAVALWKNQDFKWKERVSGYGLVNPFEDLYPAASYMISLGAGVAMGKGEPGRWAEPGRLWKEVTFEMIVQDPRGAPMWIIPKDWETVQYVFAIQGLVHRGGISVSSNGIEEIGASAGLVIDPF